MDQELDKKNKITREIRDQIERNKYRIYGNSQGNYAASSPSGSSGESGSSGADQGSSGGDAARSSKNRQGRKTSGSEKSGIRDRLAESAKAKAQEVKDRAKERVKDTAAYKQVSSKLEAARAAKERVRKQADEKFNKMIGETGRKALEAKRKLNIIKNKIDAKKKAFKKALNAKARKSHIPSGVVKIVAVVTLVLALGVDVLDLLGEVLVELGTIPTIIAYLINFVCSIIISASWFIIFSGSKGKNDRQAKVIMRSIILLFGLENVPILELLPFNVIAVILNYLDYRAGQKEESSN